MFDHDRIRVAFLGSSPLSCAYLSALAESPAIDVALVITQPDKPKGRNRKITPGPVKRQAFDLGVPVITPISINAPFLLETLAGLGIDAIVVMAYGQILKEPILNLPPLGCVNLHVSLLPRWRGAAPIQRAILAGDEQTGVTAMRMEKGLDTGDILDAVSCDIAPNETADSLGAKLSGPGCALMLSVLDRLAKGTCKRVKQDDARATLAPKIKKEETWLDWSLSAAENERKIRAFNGATTRFPSPDGTSFLQVKVLEAIVEPLPPGMACALPGTLLEVNTKKGPLVAGGAGKALRLTSIHPEGKPRPMPGNAFANGYRAHLPVGTRLAGEERSGKATT